MKVNPKHIRVFDPFNYYVDTESWNDLLRYDLGFVKRGGSGVIIFPKIVTTKSGAYSQGPTIDRWNSFGFRMDEIVGERRDQILFDFSAQTQNWLTMRRPLNRRHNDKVQWVEVTLDQFLQAKDIYEMDLKISEALKEGEGWPTIPAPIIER